MRVTGVAFDLLVLDGGQMNLAFVGTDDDGADSADRLATAGFQIAEHDRAGGPDLDDLAGHDVVHELGAGHLALNVFHQRGRRFGLGCHARPDQYGESNRCDLQGGRIGT